MRVQSLAIADVKLITPERFTDHRGFFAETYSERAFREVGVDVRFVQDNHSFSRRKGTVRGLHFQRPPHAQAKLVRVVRGSILDVAVDARKASPTFGKWVSAELSAANGAQLFIPAGFLHGFMTLEDDAEVVYKVDDYYSRECDGAVRWNDRDLAIAWGPMADPETISEKDTKAQSWTSFKSPF